MDRILNDDFEKSGHHNILFPYRIIEQGQTYYLNMDIPEIELILTADGVGYENGRIDREFLSKKATRIYFPHTFNIATGYNIPVDYFIVPSKTLMKIYAHHIKDSKRLLPCGYPTLDVAISKYHYQSQNTLTYAPTLRPSFFCTLLKSLIESIEEKKDREYFYNLRESDIYNVGKSEEAILEKIEEILAKR